MAQKNFCTVGDNNERKRTDQIYKLKARPNHPSRTKEYRLNMAICTHFEIH